VDEDEEFAGEYLICLTKRNKVRFINDVFGISKEN
jgi:hypothetical protein